MDYQTLHAKTVVELRRLAKERQVRLPAGISKADIVMRLLEAEEGAAGLPNTQPAEAPKPAGPEEPTEERVNPVQPVKSEEMPEKSTVPVRQEAEEDAPSGQQSNPSPAEPVRPSGPRTVNARPRQSGYRTPYANPQRPMMARPGEGAQRYRQNRSVDDSFRSQERRPEYRNAYEEQPRRADFQRSGEGYPRRSVDFQRGYEESSRRGAEGSARSFDEAPRRPEGDFRSAREEGFWREAPRRAFGDMENAACGEDVRRRPAEEAEPMRVRRDAVDFNADGAPMGDFADGAGVLEILNDGYGLLRVENFQPSSRDIYISMAQIRRFNLRTGDFVEGKIRPQREGDRYGALMYISRINGETPELAAGRKPFESLVPWYPSQRLRLEEKGGADLSMRLIDMLAPIGKGQRGMIVSQPKAGKTTLLKKVANAISANNPEVELYVLLIDERPEEVTDMKRSIRGNVIYSTFDEAPENHTRVAELVLEHAQRMVEMGKDVVILMDSITRLARAYNLVIPPTGRSLSGGLDPGALYKPKRFFGAARNIENGGSLTIIATALVDTGSRMDDIIYEEFKGTGNMELHLDRKLSDKRIFPAIDLVRSGTRREELLMSKEELAGAYRVRRMLSNGNVQESTEQLIGMMEKSENNEELFNQIKKYEKVYEKDGFSIKGSRS